MAAAATRRPRAEKFNDKSMKFQKGHKLAKGGARQGAGRLSREKKAIRAEVKRLVELELEKHVMAVIGAGKRIATGVKRRKHNPKTGEVYYEIEYDGAMIRHWIDKFAPDAAKTLGVNLNGPDEFYRALEAARRRKAELKQPPARRDSETKVELLHGQGSKKPNQRDESDRRRDPRT